MTSVLKGEDDDIQDIPYNLDLFMSNVIKNTRIRGRGSFSRKFRKRSRYYNMMRHGERVELPDGELQEDIKQGVINDDGTFINEELEPDEDLHMAMAPKKNENIFKDTQESIQNANAYNHRYNTGPTEDPINQVLKQLNILPKNISDLSDIDKKKLIEFLRGGK